MEIKKEDFDRINEKIHTVHNSLCYSRYSGSKLMSDLLDAIFTLANVEAKNEATNDEAE